MKPDDPRHGTTNGYVNLHCRCTRCRAANTAQVAARSDRSLYEARRVRKRAGHLPRKHPFSARWTQERAELTMRQAAEMDALIDRQLAEANIWTKRSRGGRHGIPSRYNRGCRCEECRGAESERQRRYRATRATRITEAS